jgi:DNA-binding transcriptional LysR family regulator
MFENLFSLGGLSLDRLKSFIDVAEQGSIARVADGDPSRQSLISRQIGELESFFGVELTRRKGKGLVLTEAGLELARQVRLQFQGLSDFKASCTAQPVEFRIASGNSVLEWLLAPQLARVAAAVPGTYALLDWRTGDTVRGLLDHTVDFGIIRRSALVSPLKFHPLGEIRYRLFAPKAANRNPADLPLAITMGGEFVEAFEKSTAKLRPKPNVVFRCTSFTQAAQLVRSGAAAAILPHIAAAQFDQRVAAQDPPWLRPIKRELGLAWHRRVLDVRPGSRRLKDTLIALLTKALA